MWQLRKASPHSQVIRKFSFFFLVHLESYFLHVSASHPDIRNEVWTQPNLFPEHYPVISLSLITFSPLTEQPPLSYTCFPYVFRPVSELFYSIDLAIHKLLPHCFNCYGFYKFQTSIELISYYHPFLVYSCLLFQINFRVSVNLFKKSD